MHARLAHRTIRDAKVQAFHRPLLGPAGRGFRGGLVLDEQDEQDDKLRHRRHNEPQDRYDDRAVYHHRLDGAYIYGGPMYDHFGHFMAEMVHRIVPSRLMFGAVPCIFATLGRHHVLTSFESLPDYARDVLQLLGISADDFRLVVENTVVEQLFVSEQGSELGVGPKPGYLDDLLEYTTPRLDALHGGDARPRKVYVSRAGMPGGKFLGERYLEAQLASEGFSIMQPETLPITVQMDIYRKAEVLVFAEGSACHGVELLGTGTLGRCALLVRRAGHAGRFEEVLRPRAAAFAVSDGHPFIGTRFTDGRTNAPVVRFGVHLLNTATLLEFFRSHGMAKLPTFDATEYFAAAELDLAQYQAEDNSPRRQRWNETGAADEMFDTFRAARSAMAT